MVETNTPGSQRPWNEIAHIYRTGVSRIKKTKKRKEKNQRVVGVRKAENHTLLLSFGKGLFCFLTCFALLFCFFCLYGAAPVLFLTRTIAISPSARAVMGRTAVWR